MNMNHRTAARQVMQIFWYLGDYQPKDERDMLRTRAAESACQALYEALMDAPEKCADGAAECHDRAQEYQELALAERV